MAREIGGAGGPYVPQIKRVSVRSNGAGHANAGVVTAAPAPAKPGFSIKDTVSIKGMAANPPKR